MRIARRAVDVRCCLPRLLPLAGSGARPPAIPGGRAYCESRAMDSPSDGGGSRNPVFYRSLGRLAELFGWNCDC